MYVLSVSWIAWGLLISIIKPLKLVQLNFWSRTIILSVCSVSSWIARGLLPILCQRSFQKNNLVSKKESKLKSPRHRSCHRYVWVRTAYSKCLLGLCDSRADLQSRKFLCSEQRVIIIIVIINNNNNNNREK